MPPIVLRANNASPWTGPTGNNTYLLIGPSPALIDAGVGDPLHQDEIARSLGGQPLELVLLTHGHPDHAGGLPAIAARWPEVRIIRFDAGRPLPAEPIRAGGVALRAMHTPGHAPDHLCFFDEAGGDLYCGDLVRAGGTIAIPASKGGNLRQYLATLRAVRDLGPRRLWPGHGPAIDDPKAAIDEYLQHRQDRERQIVDLVRLGTATAEAIAKRIYGELPGAIAAGAADTVLAHLVKLEEEGRACRSAGGEWMLA